MVELNRIIGLLFFIVLIASPVLAIDYIQEPNVSTTDLTQLKATIAKISSQQEQIKASCDASLKSSDLEAVKSDFINEAQAQIRDVMQKMVITLIVFLGFSLAIIFLIKSKGWF